MSEDRMTESNTLQSDGGLFTRTHELARRLTESNKFEYAIILVILFNGGLLGVGTVDSLEDTYHTQLEIGQWAVLGIFIVEAALKMFALAPRPWNYFREGWNVFDFLIIVASLVPTIGFFATITRVARLLRMLRLFSAIPELRLLVTTLVRSLPGMLNIVIMVSVLSYVYAIIGHELFEHHDPTHWHNLGISLLSLFRVVTLEDWTDIMYTAMELHPLSWIYFVSFVVLGSFVTVNLFIAVVISNLDEAKRERLRQFTEMGGPEEMLKQLRAIQESLNTMEQELAESVSEGEFPQDGDEEEEREEAGR